MTGYEPPPRYDYRAPAQGGGYGRYQQPPGYAQPQHAAPSYGPPPKAKGSGCFKAALITTAVIAVLLLGAGIIGVLAASDSDDNEGGSESGGQEVFAVGQTAHTGDADVTVHTITDPYTDPSGLLTPTEGMRWVAVEATITNPSDELVTWSSLLQSELTDSLGRPWNLSVAGTDLPRLDGDVPIQGQLRGWLVYEVAADATGLQLRIKGNLTATGSLFQLTQ